MRDEEDAITTRPGVTPHRAFAFSGYSFPLADGRDLTDYSAGDVKMEISTEQKTSVQSELERRHKATATTVLSLLIGVVLLCVMALVSKRFLTERSHPSLEMAVLITILIFGLGAIAFRRTKFAAMRLQDIAALKGPVGLLITLQRTTLQVAFIGTSTAVIGFVTTLITGDPSYTYRGGVIAVAVLLYCYPVRTSWEKAVIRFSPAQNAP
jgi:anaerobic C4-dicarboxylate transporter